MQKQEHSISRLCQVLGVSRSGYYAWKSRGPSGLEQADNDLKAEIDAIFVASRQTYGSTRIYAKLKEPGRRCSRRRVARLMKELGLAARNRRKKRPRTTIAEDSHPVAPNLLDQDFTADHPHQKWVADISYIDTQQGWLYLAVILDIYTRQVVGWALDDHMREDLIAGAFLMAVGRCHPPQGLMHHSDRGSQYTSSDYQSLLASHQMVSSMSRTGNCYDNALVESFFSTLKWECADRPFSSFQQARLALFEYIEVWYNRQRLHSSLGYLSPTVFEQRYWDNLHVH